MIKLNQRFTILVLAALLVSAFTTAAFGQDIFGTISGTVTDSSGAVLANAQVVILNQDTGATRTLSSDAAGRYLAGSLAPGSYKVTATAPGFQTTVRDGIGLTVAQEAVVNLALTVGASTQTIEVTGEVSAVETTTATISQLVAAEQIRELPLNGRSLEDLSLLTPGVNYARITGNSQGDGFGPRLSIAGARSESNLMLIDGSVVNDRTGQTAAVSGETLGVDGVREFRIISHNFDAEYGRNSGGVVSMVTRSGTNQFHGSAYEFLRNNDLDARDFFNASSSAPPLKRNQFGGAIGGPVKKDRLFFFFNFEGLRWRATQPVVATTPDANARLGIIPGQAPITVSPLIMPYLTNLALWPLPNAGNNGDGTGQYRVDAIVPNNENYYLGRIDYRVGDKDNLYGRYIYDPNSRNRLQPIPNFVRPDVANKQYLGLGETHIFSANVVNDFRAAFNRTALNSASIPLIPIPANLAFYPLQDPSLGMGDFSVGQGTQSTGQLTVVGSKNGITINYNDVLETADGFTVTRGPHSFKLGYELAFTRQNINTIPGGGEYIFNSLADLLVAKPSELTGNVNVPGVTTGRNYREGIFGWFIQDDYRLRKNLTLNLGLRHEFQLDRNESHGYCGSYAVGAAAPVPGPCEVFSKMNFAPRLGLAWDPFGKGKTAIRGGVGVYHDQITGSQLPSPPNTLAINTAFDIKDPNGTILNVTFPHGFPASIPPAASSSIATVQNPLPTPTSIHFSLDVQHQLTSTLTARVGYVGTYAYNQTRFTQQNIRVFTTQSDGSPFWAAGAAKIYPAPAPGTISELVADAHANYNALQATLQKSVGKGLMFTLNYTFAKALSQADSVTNRAIDNAGPFTALDANNPSRDYGLSGYNQKHTFVANAQYQLPLDRRLSKGFAKSALGGWVLKGIWTYGSGMPVDIFMGFNNSRSGATGTAERPDLLPGFSNNPISGVTAGCTGIPAGQRLGTPNLWFDPCAFGASTAGTWGNLGRDTVSGPNYNQTSIGVTKAMQITERMKLEFRAEAFNALNHPSFGVVQASVITASTPALPNQHAGNEGQITSTVSQGRQIQFGLKLVF